MCRAGADLLNDAWGGFDPALAEVAAEHGAALVCTHTNGATPRTPPHRPSYDDVVAAAIEATVALAERAVSLGVTPGQRADRPGPRLRQEHLALARGHPPARRDGRDRLAGAGVAVQQGLRRRDPRPAGRGAARRHARRDRGQRLARRPGVPRARGRRDPAGARHGRQHPRHDRPPGAASSGGSRDHRRRRCCPHPPLLFRELGGAQDPVADLRAAVPPRRAPRCSRRRRRGRGGRRRRRGPRPGTPDAAGRRRAASVRGPAPPAACRLPLSLGVGTPAARGRRLGRARGAARRRPGTRPGSDVEALAGEVRRPPATATGAAACSATGSAAARRQGARATSTSARSASTTTSRPALADGRRRRRCRRSTPGWPTS